MNKNWSFETKAVHVGSEPDPHTGAVVKPIYQTSTYVFKNTEEAEKIFSGESFGYIYGRTQNPTQSELEEKIAALEGGEACKTFASGMAAITAATMAILKAGDHVICDDVVYGGTYGLLTKIFPRYGIEVSFLDTSNIKNIEKALKPNTKLVYVETPANPTLKIINIKEVADFCKSNRLRFVVDNTFMTPYFQRPLELGADIVVHSATKYMGGHGDLLAGAVIGSENFVHEELHDPASKLGGGISPFTCFLIKRGLQTLPLRMEKHNSNAMKVAEYLMNNRKIRNVVYPGLPDFPQHELAKEQMSGFGGLISFEVEGGLKQARQFCDSLNMIGFAVSLGDVGTLIQLPALMTHRSVSEEDKKGGGISDGLLRLSVGLENEIDIIADIDQALEKVK